MRFLGVLLATWFFVSYPINAWLMYSHIGYRPLPVVSAESHEPEPVRKPEMGPEETSQYLRAHIDWMNDKSHRDIQQINRDRKAGDRVFAFMLSPLTVIFIGLELLAEKAG